MQSPIDDRHRALGAKLTPFGGWDMPLSYPDGTLDEHRACRRDSAVFDVSHLGTLRVSGAGAFDRLQLALTNDLNRIEPGRAQYTHLLDPADASVVDDIIVWWIDDDTFDVMPNASNTARVEAALDGLDAVDAKPMPVDAVDITAGRAILAVQGPRARERLGSVFPEASEVGRFRVAKLDWNGTACTVAGTGYTGEDGVEVSVPVDAAAALWDAVLAAGVTPAGLGARDTLRLEAGLPLHGHELGPGVTPLQAGLGWVVRWDKGQFIGREALQAERDGGVSRLLRGLRCVGRRPPRADQRVLVDARSVGVVTSGNFSPVLEVGIAMAFVDPALEVGSSVQIEGRRGEMIDAEIVEMPFIGR